jgi:hypothetical protein
LKLPCSCSQIMIDIYFKVCYNILYRQQSEEAIN